MDERTRKLMTMIKALHSGDDIDCACQKENGKRLTNIEDSISASTRELHNFFFKRLFTAASYSNDNIKSNRKATKTRK